MPFTVKCYTFNKSDSSVLYVVLCFCQLCYVTLSSLHYIRGVKLPSPHTFRGKIMSKKTFFAIAISLVFISGCLPKTTNVPPRRIGEIRWEDTPARISYMMSHLQNKSRVERFNADLGSANRAQSILVKISQKEHVLGVYTFRNFKLQTVGYITFGSFTKIHSSQIPMPNPDDPRTKKIIDSPGVLTFVDRDFYDEFTAKYQQLRHKKRLLTFTEQFTFGIVSRSTYIHSRYTYLRERGVLK